MTGPRPVKRFEDQWRERFERYARRYPEEHSISGWSVYGLRRRVAVFQELLDQGLLRPGARVLEVGCGAGTYVRLLAKRGHPTVGLDYSVPSLGRALAADPAALGRYVAGAAYALPFGPARFDGIVCIGVLQALAQPEIALGEITRVLGPGGRLIVETLNPWSPPAIGRRARSRLKGEPPHLHYGAPRLVERMLADAGARALRRVGLLLPPRSLTGLGAALARPWVGRLVATMPALRSLVPHAFWIIGEKA